MTWTCEQTRRHLQHQEIMSEAAMDHLARCPVCQEMTGLPAVDEPDSGATSNGGSLDISRLLDETQRQIQREKGVLAWLRSRPTSVQLGLGLGTALIPALAQLILARREDWGDYPLPRLLATATAYMLAVILGAKVLVSPLYRPRSVWALRVATVYAFCLPVIVAGLASAYSRHYEAGDHSADAALMHAWACLRYGTLLSLPAVLLFFAMDRQLAAGRRFLTLAAGLGGIAGNLVLLLHCSNEQLTHQLLGHAAVGLMLLVCMGVVIGLTRVRAKN